MDAPRAPRVTRPLMLHRWSKVTFLHWPYPPEVVRRLLPDGLELETVDGRAWVGLVPFLMEDVRPPGLPAAPWLSRFPETNVRTYVRGPDGRRGIWFMSLDAARLPAVLAARATYGLPYFWSRATVAFDRHLVGYAGRRRWPGPRDARCEATVEPGDPIDPGELDHFLTARYTLFSLVAGQIVAADAEHEPWPLRRAELLGIDQDLLQAGGLPEPQGSPLVHYSPGVTVRVGAWSRVPARTAGVAPVR